MLRLPRPAWHADAACRDMDPAVFFPQPGRTSAPAKRVCADCPVVQECARMALDDHGLDGVWGGMTAGERDHIRQGAAA